MIIDGHQHVFENIKEQIAINKRCKVDSAVLFPSIVHPENARTKDEFKNELTTLNRILSGEINPIEARIASIRQLTDSIKNSDGHFIGFGSCPFGIDLRPTSDWIEKYIISNNLRGIGELALPSGKVNALENIFRVVQDSNKPLPLWIHTFNPLQFTDITEILTLANKYNRAKVILGHSGGSFWLEVLELVQDRKNIYMDTSASFTNYSIQFIAECLPDRCLFSSDLPYGDPSLCINQIEHVIRDKGIRSRVLGENTSELLGI